VGKILMALVTVVLLFAGAIFAASELGGEVVELTTYDPEGRSYPTSVWIVEDHEQLWLRAGDSGSAWFLRLEQTPEVEVERDGVRRAYTAVPMPRQRDRINPEFAEKYGWADRLIGTMRDDSATTPIRLDPTDS
jgi:hypothetical protein